MWFTPALPVAGICGALAKGSQALTLDKIHTPEWDAQDSDGLPLN